MKLIESNNCGVLKTGRYFLNEILYPIEEIIYVTIIIERTIASKQSYIEMDKGRMSNG